MQEPQHNGNESKQNESLRHRQAGKIAPSVHNEITSLRQKESRLEQELMDAYCELGKKLLEMAEMEGKKVNDLVDKLIAVQRKLDILEHKQTDREETSE
ncbi:hypothetical protein LJC63_04480 [Ruminococcaceae bacterium OttesenSCG-928-L11]|nr:hypothetical protein [Ruminococcaceae bacterium OttesenSCG-928-L11]